MAANYPGIENISDNCEQGLNSLLIATAEGLLPEKIEIHAAWVDFFKKKINYAAKLAEIKNIAEKKSAKLAYEHFINYCNHVVLLELANEIQVKKNKSKSLSKTLKKIKSWHINYLNKNPNLMIEKSFFISTGNRQKSFHFKSQQDFTFNLTNYQFNQLYGDAPKPNQTKQHAAVCYDRSKPGLSAARHHTLSINTIPCLSYWHHSSPIPYVLPDFRKRIDISQVNLQQLASNILQKFSTHYTSDQQNEYTVPITEVRLLSPLNKALSVFDNEQKQCQQILETYLSAILVDGQATQDTHQGKAVRFKADMRMHVYGVNKFRAWHSPLQNYINTRSLNELFCDFLPENILEKDLKNSLAIVQQQRETLASNVKNLYQSKHKDEQMIKTDFVAALKEHHRKYEKVLYQQLANHLNQILAKAEDSLINQDLQLVLNLVKDAQWTKPQYNYQLQAALVRLNAHKREVATGCNDAKDRDGRLAVTLEAQEIFRVTHDHYANPFDTGEQAQLRVLERKVYYSSSPRFAAERASMSGAQHCELHATDGNHHLVNELSMTGKMFKKMHHVPKTVKLAYFLKQKVDIKQFFIAALVILGISLGGGVSPATAATFSYNEIQVVSQTKSNDNFPVSTAVFEERKDDLSEQEQDDSKNSTCHRDEVKGSSPQKIVQKLNSTDPSNTPSLYQNFTHPKNEALTVIAEDINPIVQLSHFASSRPFSFGGF